MTTTSSWPSDTYIVIPSYRSSQLLKAFLPTLLKTVPAGAVCVVDDASKDGTPDVCSTFGIVCLSHATNLGKGAALRTGFTRLLQNTTARWIITMDADGQHAPADLEKFREAASEQPPPGIIIGARSMKSGTMPLARICSNQLTSKILSLLTKTRVVDSQCGYRLYSADFLRNTTIEYNRFQMESEVILKAVHSGFPIRFVKVQTLYLDGESHISHLKDTIRWTKAVLKIYIQNKRSVSPISEKKA